MIAGVPRSATTTDVFNAIAEEGRRDLLDALARGEATVGDLVARVGMSQPQVSKHLGVLREVGVVRVRVDGRHRWYRIYGPALKPVHAWVRRFERTSNQSLDSIKQLFTELQ
jgi:DNA-binding transcriptional ArsR family regulator